MNRTSIEWTDFSANPLKFRTADGRVVWACVHASPGCTHCYSEALATRYRRGGPFNVPTTSTLTPFLDEAELRSMLTYKQASGERCFVGDMTDIFGEWVPDELLDRLFAAMALRHDVTWQVLTKRAARMREYFVRLDASTHAPGFRDWPQPFHAAMPYLTELLGADRMQRLCETPDVNCEWPLPNVWIGVSCEDQQRANERIPELLKTPAAVRFVSCEPLLGPLDLNGVTVPSDYRPTGQKLDWVIVGGESGPGARPCDILWIRAIVQQCQSAGVACFVKQLGSKPEQPQGCGDCDPCLAGQRCYQSYNIIMDLRDRKGGDPAEWPEDLRVREFPRSAVPA